MGVRANGKEFFVRKFQTEKEEHLLRYHEKQDE